MSDFYSTWEKNYFNWSLPWQCDLVGHEPSIRTAESALGRRLTRGLPLAFTLHFWFNVHVSADRKKQKVKRMVHLSCRAYSTGWESKAVDWKKKDPAAKQCVFILQWLKSVTLCRYFLAFSPEFAEDLEACFWTCKTFSTCRTGMPRFSTDRQSRCITELHHSWVGGVGKNKTQRLATTPSGFFSRVQQPASTKRLTYELKRKADAC